MADEQWRNVLGWDDYQVSDAGQVRRLERRVRQTGPQGEYTRTFPTRIYRTAPDGRGYMTAHFRHNGRSQVVWLHRLVLSTFVGEAPEGTECYHINGDRAENRLANLKWATRSENILDSVQHGTHNMTRKTHCPQGHEYTPENTYTYVRNRSNGRKTTERACKACHRVKSRPDRLKGLAE